MISANADETHDSSSTEIITTIILKLIIKES